MTKAFGALATGLCILTLSLGAYAMDDGYKAAKNQADATYNKAAADCSKNVSDTERKKDCMKKAKADHNAAKDKLKSMK